MASRRTTKSGTTETRKGKRISLFAIRPILIVVVIFFCLCFVAFIGLFRYVIKPPTYLYVRVKMGQGLWWANTQKPSVWFTQAIRNAKPSTDVVGRIATKVLGVRTYSWGSGNQYETYVDLQLNASVNNKQDKYIYNRTPIAVGAPIEVELPGVEFSGTVIELAQQPIHHPTTTKIVTLTKRGEMPWEYEQIMVGDRFSNGKEEVFRVLDKATVETLNLSDDLYGNYPTNSMESKRYIVVKIQIHCARSKDGKLIYAEEFALIPGKNFGLQSERFNFSDYVISQVE